MTALMVDDDCKILIKLLYRGAYDRPFARNQTSRTADMAVRVIKNRKKRRLHGQEGARVTTLGSTRVVRRSRGQFMSIRTEEISL